MNSFGNEESPQEIRRKAPKFFAFGVYRNPNPGALLGHRLEPIKVGPFHIERRRFCQRSPYVAFIVRFGDDVLGGQISAPSLDDCLSHARAAVERAVISRTRLAEIHKACGTRATFTPTRLLEASPSELRKAESRKAGNAARHKRGEHWKVRAARERVQQELKTGMRKCTRCRTEKPLETFRQQGARRGSWCIPCERASARDSQARMRQQAKTQSQ